MSETLESTKESQDAKIVDTKYWIKTGISVMHRDHQHRKMVVDKIVKESKVIKDGDKEIRKSFVIGVDCHWMDAEGQYGKGRFLTMELMPYED